MAILVSTVAFLDSTVVNLALPAIKRDLGGGLATSSGLLTATCWPWRPRFCPAVPSRTGGGRDLYTRLLRLLTERGYRQPSPASPNRTRPVTSFIDPSDFRMWAPTDASHGSTTAGTTSHGCNSICSALPTPGRPARRSPKSHNRKVLVKGLTGTVKRPLALISGWPSRRTLNRCPSPTRSLRATRPRVPDARPI